MARGRAARGRALPVELAAGRLAIDISPTVGMHHCERFPIRRADNQVVVGIDKVYHSDQHAAAWQAAVVTL